MIKTELCEELCVSFGRVAFDDISESSRQNALHGA